jgi:hypothetical protein
MNHGLGHWTFALLADTPERWPEVPSPGSVLGPYRTVRPLGQGGMGAVYEAEEIETGRRRASGPREWPTRWVDDREPTRRFLTAGWSYGRSSE